MVKSDISLLFTSKSVSKSYFHARSIFHAPSSKLGKSLLGAMLTSIVRNTKTLK